MPKVGKGNFNRKIRKPTGKLSVKQTIFTLIAVVMICLLLVYGAMRLAGWWDDRQVSQIEKNNTRTIGTVIKIGSQKGSYAIVEYFVHGIGYNRRDASPSDKIFVGEHYEVVYAENDPQQSRIDFSAPHFLKEETTEFTTGTVFSKDFAKVGFKYYVNDREIRRWQHYKKGLDVKKGETYQVEYLVENPNIGILKLNGL